MPRETSLAASVDVRTLLTEPMRKLWAVVVLTPSSRVREAIARRPDRAVDAGHRDGECGDLARGEDRLAVIQRRLGGRHGLSLGVAPIGLAGHGESPLWRR